MRCRRPRAEPRRVGGSVGAARSARHIQPSSREGDVVGATPGEQDRVRRDDAVIAQTQHRSRVNLEVEMRRAAVGVAGVAHEADHVTCLHAATLDGERRVGREMRVVELVARSVTEPEPVAADPVEADGMERPVGDGEKRRALRREDVLAVVPAARAHPRAAPRSCRRTTRFRRWGRRSLPTRAWPTPPAQPSPGRRRPRHPRRARAPAGSGPAGRPSWADAGRPATRAVAARAVTSATEVA